MTFLEIENKLTSREAGGMFEKVRQDFEVD